jgi:hypothetical protein
MDDIEHPTLGVLKLHFERGWLGKCADADMRIMFPRSVDEFDDPPPPDEGALAMLADAVQNVQPLKAQAVGAICAARQARLNWRPGPAAEAWSVTELCIDRDGALWVALHEYETDEYSRWLVRVDRDAIAEVRRAPAVENYGAPGEAGVLV